MEGRKSNPRLHFLSIKAMETYKFLHSHFVNSYGHDKISIITKRSINSVENSWFVSHEVVSYFV